MKRLTLSLAMLCCASSFAAQTPTASRGDTRVRFVDYDPNNVVTIMAGIGVDTLIMFGPGEQVLDMPGGDSAAWDIGVLTGKNGISIKPKKIDPNANLHVVTTARAYNFDLKLTRKRESPYFMVRFNYPTEEAQARARAGKKALAGFDAAEARAILKRAVPGQAAGTKVNRQYSAQGEARITPVEAFDDGTTTTLRFAAHGTVPAVYVIDADGAEKRINATGAPNDTLLIDTVAPRFVLRVGNTMVACVYNERFDPVGKRPLTNTASPLVERTLKEQP